MSETGKDFREARERKRKAQRDHSVLCWKCGTRVWDDQEKCRSCDADNDNQCTAEGKSAGEGK